MTQLSARERRLADRARAQREEAIRLLRTVTDQTIDDYVRRSRLTAVPDGHRARTLSDGQPRGKNALTSVEDAAERLVFAGTEGVAAVPDDRTGTAIRSFFEGLRAAETAADAVVRRMTDIARLGSTREYKTGGPCRCCARDVPGTEADRLRNLYCPACWMAWCRAGRPDNRAAFEDSRRTDLAAGNSETAGHTA